MSLPALRALRERYPSAWIAVQARPWVADLYARERFANQVLPYTARRGASDWAGKWRAARQLRAGHFDCAILLPNSFDSALVVWLAGIPRRIGYRRDGRGWLLTDAIPPPRPGEIPRHERFYYLELLRRAGILESLPADAAIRLEGAAEARLAGEVRFSRMGWTAPVVGVSPGAAYGGAKRWPPERFAEAAARVASAIGRRGGGVRLHQRAARRAARRGWPERPQGRRPQFRRRDHSRRIHRTGRRLPRVSHQRLRRDARGLGARRAHGGRVRRHRSGDHRAARPAEPRGAGAGRMQPVPAARVPHRPPLHDPRDRPSA